MGPPLEKRRRRRSCRPVQQALQDPAPDTGRRGRSRLRSAANPKARTCADRPYPWPARIHRAPDPHPSPAEPAGLARPPHRDRDPPLRTRPPRRADPRRREEARPDPRRRRPQDPGPPSRPRHPQQRRLRLRPLRRRRPLPPGLQRDPPRRESRDLRSLPDPGRRVLRRPGYHPDRARSHGQRVGLPQGPGLEASPGRHRGDRQTHPPLPAPDQRQGRTLQPHPRRRMGLPTALHIQRRAHRCPGRLYNHHRSHTALGGQPPISRVNNPAGQYT